jgi:hypothetical protein
VLVCSVPVLQREDNKNEDRTEPTAQDSTHATAGRWRATAQTWGRTAYAAAGEPAPVASGPFIGSPKPVCNEHNEQRMTPFTNARTEKTTTTKSTKFNPNQKDSLPNFAQIKFDLIQTYFQKFITWN